MSSMNTDPSPHAARRTTRNRLVHHALALILLVLTGACSSGAEAGSSRFEPLEPFPEASASSTSSSSSTTTSTAGVTSSTTVSRVTTTTTRPVPATTATTRVTTPPPPPDAEPRVVASPTVAGPGSRISITGEAFVAEPWRVPNATLWLAGGPSACDFFAEADHDVRVTPDGHLAGSFLVPSHGACRQGEVGDVPVPAGVYRIVYQCTACTIGEFTVTASALTPRADCEDVWFSPNSENMAGDIVAHGLSCEEAEAVVRKVGGPLGPVNGAPRGEADGFTCVRTSQYEGRGLPSAEYECTRGSQRIRFTRT